MQPDISDKLVSEGTRQSDTIQHLSIPEVQYVIGASVLLTAAAVLGYYLNRKPRPVKKYEHLLDRSTAQES